MHAINAIARNTTIQDPTIIGSMSNSSSKRKTSDLKM